MPDDLQHSILARSIAGRAQLSSLAEVRVLDVCLATLEAIRNGPAGHAWTRRLATGPGDIDTSYHLARRLRATIATACGGSWLIDDAVEVSTNPPLDRRCHACWRAAAASSPGGPALGEALLVVVAEMALEDREVAGRREQARSEMLGERSAGRGDIHSDHFAHCTFECDPEQPRSGFCNRDGFTIEAHCERCYSEAHAAPATEFAVDQHLTRLDTTSAVIAFAEVERAIDQDPYGVELDWGPDAEWGISEAGGEGG